MPLSLSLSRIGLALGGGSVSSAVNGGGGAPTLQLSSTSVAEDAALSTVVGALSVANLPDGVTVSGYSITADPDSKFDLSSANLITDATLDYDTSTSHSVTIRATLSEGDPVDRTFAISVTNVADTAPEQFATGDWSVADLGTNGDVRLTIISLPASDGAITDIEYQIDGGSWVPTGLTAPGTADISGLTDGTEYDIAIRAVNATGNGTASATKAVTPTGVPAAFTAGQWSVADAGEGGTAAVTISALPAANGAAIGDVEFRVDAGSWISSGGTTDFDITGLTDTVEVTIELRAVNANGPGGDSDDKTVTPTAVWSPTSLYSANDGYLIDASGTLYQDTAGTTPVTAGGQKVAWAPNLSGYAGEMKQSVASPQPTYNTADGLHWMDFDGIDDHLFDTSAIHYGAGAASAYASVRMVAQSDKRIFFEGSAANNNPLYSLVQTFSATQNQLTAYIRNDSVSVLYNGGQDGAAFSGVDVIVGVEDDGSNLNFYVDGALTQTRAYTRSGALTLNRTSIGALLRATASFFMAGRLYAICTIDRNLNTTERANLTTWLGAKQGRSL